MIKRQELEKKKEELEKSITDFINNPLTISKKEIKDWIRSNLKEKEIELELLINLVRSLSKSNNERGEKFKVFRFFLNEYLWDKLIDSLLQKISETIKSTKGQYDTSNIVSTTLQKLDNPKNLLLFTQKLDQLIQQETDETKRSPLISFQKEFHQAFLQYLQSQGKIKENPQTKEIKEYLTNKGLSMEPWSQPRSKPPLPPLKNR